MIFLGLGASLLILLNRLEFRQNLPSGTDNKCDLGLGFDEEVSCGFGSSLISDKFGVSSGQFGGVLSGLGSLLLAYGSTGSFNFSALVSLLLGEIGISGGLLANALWNCSLSFSPKTRNKSVSLCHVKQLS